MTAALLCDMAQAHAERDQRDKVFNSAQARAAIAGFQLYVSNEGGQPVFILTRWGWCKAFTDVDGAVQFLDEAGIP